MMLGRLCLDREIDDSDLKGLPQYTDFKKKFTNTCLKCDKQFKFRAFEFDDARFVRFCTYCRKRANSADCEIDFNGTVGS